MKKIALFTALLALSTPALAAQNPNLGPVLSWIQEFAFQIAAIGLTVVAITWMTGTIDVRKAAVIGIGVIVIAASPTIVEMVKGVV